MFYQSKGSSRLGSPGCSRQDVIAEMTRQLLEAVSFQVYADMVEAGSPPIQQEKCSPLSVLLSLSVHPSFSFFFCFIHFVLFLLVTLASHVLSSLDYVEV